MLIFFVFVKLLSLMTNTRVGQPNHSEREISWSSHPCSCKRPYKGLWNIHREYAGGSRIEVMTGANRPCHFIRIYDIINKQNIY